MRSIIILSVLAFSLFSYSAEENNNEWLNKHAVITETTTSGYGSDNILKTIKVVKDTTIYIKQIVTEIRKPDGKGGSTLISRTTSTTDTMGGSATIIESLIAGSSLFNKTTMLVITSITTVDKTPEATITTVHSRDKNGNMVMVSKTVISTTKNGTAPAVTL